MPDRKKVMRGLMHHSGKEIPIPCDNCPYDDDEPYCSQRLAADALSLLKEQEAVEPKLYTPESKTIWSSWYICGACEYPVDPGDKFCRKCGRPIKWEEDSDAE